MTPAEKNELWVLMHMAQIIARLYGLGYGEQPVCWPKHEQTEFAEAMASGRWQRAMQTLKG